MRRIYKGTIWKDYLAYTFLAKVMEPEDIKAKNCFTPVGMLSNGRRTMLTYALCDKDGEIIESLSHIQFGRSRKNVFYIESVN